MLLVAQGAVHRWLHDYPGILHRDLSPRNIMHRLIERVIAESESKRKVYGVLTNFHLSSWRDNPENDLTRASEPIIGTPTWHRSCLWDRVPPTCIDTILNLFSTQCCWYADTLSPAGDGTREEAERRMVGREGRRPYQT